MVRNHGDSRGLRELRSIMGSLGLGFACFELRRPPLGAQDSDWGAEGRGFGSKPLASRVAMPRRDVDFRSQLQTVVPQKPLIAGLQV